MFRFIKSTSIVAASVLGVTALAGCASTSSSPGTATAPATAGAMSCPTCQTTWVARASSHGTKVQRYSSEKVMTCPTCDASAAAYLVDGKTVLHDCPECKVAPTPLKAVPPLESSHPKGTHS
jgi:hypothetical protein